MTQATVARCDFIVALERLSIATLLLSMWLLSSQLLGKIQDRGAEKSTTTVHTLVDEYAKSVHRHCIESELNCGPQYQCIGGLCVRDTRMYYCAFDNSECPDGFYCDTNNNVCRQNCPSHTSYDRNAAGFCLCSSQDDCELHSRCNGESCQPHRTIPCHDGLVRVGHKCFTPEEASVVLDKKVTRAPYQTLANITVILNVFKRAPQLYAQLHRVFSASTVPRLVWVCIFASPIRADMIQTVETFRKVSGTKIQIFSSSFNFQYFGRFMLALQAPTDHVVILDDDQITRSRSIEKFIATYKTLGTAAMLGLTGRAFASPRLPADKIPPYHLPGYEGNWRENSQDCRMQSTVQLPSIVAVDGLNRHWFAPPEVLRYLFIRMPHTFSTMEDYTVTHFAWKYGHLPTYTVCPEAHDEFIDLMEGDEGSSTDNNDMNEFRMRMINRMHFSGHANVGCISSAAEALIFKEIGNARVFKADMVPEKSVAIICETAEAFEVCLRTMRVFCIDASARSVLRRFEEVLTSAHGLMCMTNPSLVDTSEIQTPQFKYTIDIANQMFAEGCEDSCRGESKMNRLRDFFGRNEPTSLR